MNAALKNAAPLCSTLACLALACVAPACVALAGRPAAAQPAQGALQVMSDTPEYCATLRDTLDRMPPDASPPVLAEVRSLETEGRRLCDSGETRGGILRMRRALMMMMQARARDEDEER